MATITLHASSLASKWGFSDGDVIDDVLFDAAVYDTRMPEDAHLTFEEQGSNPYLARGSLPAQAAGVWQVVGDEKSEPSPYMLWT